MNAASAIIGVRGRLAFALLAPPLAWMTFEIGLAVAQRPSCAAAGSWLGLAWGVAALGACALAAALARPIRQPSGKDGGAIRPWMARVAFLGSGVFALAIALQTLATLVVPSCAR